MAKARLALVGIKMSYEKRWEKKGPNHPYVQFCSMQSAPLVFQYAQVQNPSAVDKESKKSFLKNCQEKAPRRV